MRANPSMVFVDSLWVTAIKNFSLITSINASANTTSCLSSWCNEVIRGHSTQGIQQTKRDDYTHSTNFDIHDKVVQYWTGKKMDTFISEECIFWDFFGVGMITTVALWELLTSVDFLSKDDTILHMLWTLYLFKVYPKQGIVFWCLWIKRNCWSQDCLKHIWPFSQQLQHLKSLW